MEALGAEVLLMRADVANEDEMSEVMNHIFSRHGQLNGVLHAAGITSGPSVFNMTTSISPTAAAQQFSPKVFGVYVLEKLLRGKDVDFCLLFSSNAAVLGGLGFVAYCASNSFMDAFALARNQQSGPTWISANWDAWPEETKKYTGFKTSMDQFTMTPDESVEAFKRVATLAPAGQVVVSTGDLQARLDRWIRKSLDDRAQGAESNGLNALSPRPRSLVDYVPPGDPIEQAIAEIWEQVLGIDRVGIHESFFELGGHSLLAMKLVGRLREVFQLDIPLNEFFRAPTVSGLAQVVGMAQSEQSEREQLSILESVAQLSEDELELEIQKRVGAP
jgi:acyl carrier protein/NAD(P)-dependent dehydrogenase (short-subunit alcohol dehydrogenase family)